MLPTLSESTLPSPGASPHFPTNRPSCLGRPRHQRNPRPCSPSPFQTHHRVAAEVAYDGKDFEGETFLCFSSTDQSCKLFYLGKQIWACPQDIRPTRFFTFFHSFSHKSLLPQLVRTNYRGQQVRSSQEKKCTS